MGYTKIIVPRSEWPQKLKELGFLLNGDLIADDSYHRLVTANKPEHQNASYRIVGGNTDIPVLSVKDFADPDHCFTFYTEELARNTKKFKQRQKLLSDADEVHSQVAEQARKADKAFCANLPPAAESNGYLTTKGVRPVDGLKQDPDGELVVPMIDMFGEHRGSQRISPEGTKRFAKNCTIVGAYFKIPGGLDTGTICFAEGLATGLSVCEATGFPVYVTFGIANMGSVLSAVRKANPDEVLVICADNDIANNTGNIGVNKAKEVAAKHRAVVAFPEDIDGKSTDWNDYHMKYGLEAVAESITTQIENYVVPEVPSGFWLCLSGAEPGLYCLGEKKNTWISDILVVQGLARTPDHETWARLVTYLDHDRVEHSVLLSEADFNKDSSILMNKLQGLRYDPAHRSAIMRYVGMATSKNRIRLFEQSGWHEENSIYVLPGKVYGSLASNEEVMLYPPALKDPYTTQGSFEEWRALAALAEGNHYLTLALLIPFAGPLLRLAGMPFLCFHFVGASSSGKSTCLNLAASVCGNYKTIGMTWRATDNGLEGQCKQRNDSTMFLDEITEADPKTIKASSYMLANGEGKSRAYVTGDARPQAKWTVAAVSTGERTISEYTRDGGLSPYSGQDVRWISIPVAADDILELHGLASSAELVNKLNSELLHHNGHAYLTFLEHLVPQAQELSTHLRQDLVAVAQRLCRPYKAVPGQLDRIAQRFAMLSVAGRLASDLRILPFGQEVVDTAIQHCFTLWVEQRGGVEVDEVMRAESAVRNFVVQHEIRFRDLDSDSSELVANCAGYRKTNCSEGFRQYWILRSIFCGEVLGGRPDANPNQQILKGLRDKGLLIPVRQNGKERFVSWFKTPEGTKVQVYCIQFSGRKFDGDPFMYGSEVDFDIS